MKTKTLSFRVLAVILLVLALPAARAFAWQTRQVGDLRRGGDKKCSAAMVFGEFMTALSEEKALNGRALAIYAVTDNLKAANVGFEASCVSPERCPDNAWTVVYDYIEKKGLTLAPEKIFTDYVCKDAFADPGLTACSCRLTLARVLSEQTIRAKRAGNVMVVIALTPHARMGGPLRPGEEPAPGFDIKYVFVPADRLPPGPGVKGASAQPSAQEPQAPAKAAAGQDQPRQPAQAQPTPAQPTPAKAPNQAQAKTGPMLQAASLPSASAAEELVDRLGLGGLEAVIEPADVNGRKVYRVLVKPEPGPKGLDETKAKLAKLGFKDAIVR